LPSKDPWLLGDDNVLPSNQRDVVLRHVMSISHLQVSVASRIRPYNRRLFVDLCRPTDVIVAMIVLGIVYVDSNIDRMPTGIDDFLLLRLSVGNVLLLATLGFAWRWAFQLLGLYDLREPRSLREEAPSVAVACTLGSLLGLVPVLFSESGAYNLHVVFAAWPLTMVGTLAARSALRTIAARAHSSRARRVLIVGSGPLALRLFDRVQNDARSCCEVIGFVDSNDAVGLELVKDRLIGPLDRLEQILMKTVVDEVLIALPVKSHYAEIQQAIEECERAGVESRYSPDVFASRLARPCVESWDGQPAIAMKVVSDDYRLAIKRMIDIVGAVVGLVLLLPIMCLVAVAVVATSRGPVIFGQERYGWRKRRFKMYKFRTMVTDAEALQASLEARNEAVGPVFKIEHDPRVTPIGRFLRRTSLDELPQLWNVLRGDMSLVGPRPLPMRDVSRFSDAWLMRRFSVLPGLTGLWQVSGRSNLSFSEWVQLDLQYIDRWSLRLDVDILVRTLPAVIRGTGAR
jgi:exopolysaccharide biosynthesis polyprenyl glycosylphosphotransferase